MMSSKRHLSLKSKIEFLIFAAIIISGCGEEQPESKYVARVNNVYLSEEELAQMVDTNSSGVLLKNEIIRNWINREILFQEAEKNGILEQSDYQRIMKNSGRELAGTFLMNKYVNGKTININQRDVLEFYKQQASEFKLTEDSYLLNIIHFSNQDRAVEFRSILLDSDWQKAMNLFNSNSTIISSKSKMLVNERDLYSQKVLRVVQRLLPPEISIVIAEQEGYYTVVQVLEKYPKGSLPPFEIVKQDVKKRYLEEKRKELLEAYLSDLYSNNEIEIIN